MVQCCVQKCHNNSRSGYRFFAVPKKNGRGRDVWLQNANLKEEDLPKDARFCEAHFPLDNFKQVNNQGWMILKDGAIPTLFGDNLPKTVSSIVRGNQFAPVFVEPQSPLRENNENVDIGPPSPDSPVSKRRRFLSECATEQSESLRLQAALDEMTRKCERYRQAAIHWKKKCVNTQKNLDKFLKEDQIALLERDTASRNTKEWSEDTVRTALQIRLMVHAQGYEFLRTELHWPLPSFRTLYRKLEVLPFYPGVADDIIKWLPSKVDPADPASRLCVISFDEMKIQEGVQYDKGSKRCLGLVTPCLARNEEEEDKMASQVVAVVIRGVSGHWKQLISYAFTGAGTDRTLLWEYVKSLIVLVHQYGLKVTMVSSDMGGGNQAVWDLLGVHAVRNHINVCSPHPVPGEPDLIWMVDVPHVLKNMWAQLTRSTIVLPEHIVTTNSLPSREVTVDHVKELLLQQSNGAKLVPKLTPNHCQPAQFEKMRVGMATTFFSELHADALEFLSTKGLVTEGARTTAWFIRQVARWYHLMCNRHIFDSLGGDQFFEERQKFLLDFCSLVNDVSFSIKGRKPVQNAVLLATHSALKFHSMYVVDGPLEYVLTARFTTSGVENVFSQVRAGGVENPNATRTRVMMRLLTVSQFFHVSKHASYENDGDDHAVNFLRRDNQKLQEPLEKEKSLQEKHDRALQDVSIMDFSDEDLSLVEQCGLYYMCGWAVSKVRVQCEACISSIRSSQPLECAASEWTTLLSRGGLSHPSEAVYRLMYVVERFFVDNGKKVLKMHSPVDSILLALYDRVDDDVVSSFPDCHNVYGMICDKYINLRLHIAAKDFSRKLEVITSYASKSAFKSTASANVGKRRSLQ